MQQLDISDGAIKEELVRLIGTYINTQLENGQYGNLEGIAPILDFLEINDVDFDPSQLEKIRNFYDKYSSDFLYSMSPALYDGKLFNGKIYDKIQYVRELLQKGDAPPEELTDEYIKQLWKCREILIRLHSNLHDKALTPAQKKLSGFLTLLSDHP